MVRSGSRGSERKSLTSAIVAALLASALVWFPNSNQDAALATGDLGHDSEIDFAVDFDASSSITTSGAPIPTADGAAFSVEAWIKPDTVSGYNTILAQGNVADSQAKRFYLGLYTSVSGTFVHIGRSAAPEFANVSISNPVGRWVHVAATVASNNQINLYVDGQLLSTVSLDNAGTNVGFGIGTDEMGNGPFDGQIDQVKIWDGVLEAGEVLASMHSLGMPASGVDNSLLSHWDLNEGAGPTIFDRVGSYDLSATNVTFADVKQVTADSNGHTVVTFPRTYLPGVGGYTIPEDATNLGALVVGGGGAGGQWIGGGGGGGEFFENTAWPNLASATQSVVVGMGGVKANTSGQSSSFGGVQVDGGGAGGTYNIANPSPSYGSTGGAGNGAGFAGETSTPLGRSFNGVASFQNAGGASSGGNCGLARAGGGGGAGGAGGAASAAPDGAAGAGGSGKQSVITGAKYAAGGGGGNNPDTQNCTNVGTPGTGGDGGGGNGGAVPFDLAAASGDANTGSGGGGSSNNGTNVGMGGSGVVVLRYTTNIDLAWSKTSLSQSYAATNSQVVPASGAWTFEAWVHPASEALTGSQIFGIFTQQDDSDAEGNRAGLWVQGGAIGYNYGGTAYTRSAVALTSEQWYHLALAVTANTQKVYVNGRLFHSSEYSALTIGGNFVLGGLRQSNFLDWPGQIDQVKVWGVELNQPQIEASMHTYSTSPSTPLANCSTGLRAHYDFNEYNDVNVLDRSGCGRNLTFNTTVAGSYADSDLTDSAIVETATSNSSDVLVTFKRTYLTATGGWSLASWVSTVSALVVGGGGAGGYGADYGAGGGGGGEVVEHLQLGALPGNIVPVKVGQGGLARPFGNPNNLATSPTPGQPSTISLATPITARAGGEGASGNAGASPNKTLAASSGLFTGGGGAAHASLTAAAGTGLGFSGGSGNPDSQNADRQTGGGGAGAGENGFTGTTTLAGAGGSGVQSAITGLFYGGGGGGGKRTAQGSAAAGGAGGGGTGGLGLDGLSALANSGGGGGGAGGIGSALEPRLGGGGGSGVVVLAYSLAPDAPTSLTAAQSTSHATINLSWTAPGYTGNSAITDYDIEYKPAGGSWTSYSDGVSTVTNASVQLPTQCVSHEFRVIAKNSSFQSVASATASATPVWGTFDSLTGVQISSTNSECVVKFTSTNQASWTPPVGTDKIRALVVAGGGGGGAWVGGGGGAGGFTESNTLAVPGSALSIQVGGGGAGGSRASNASTPASNGLASTISALGQTLLAASGGGAGASWDNPAHGAGNGGSGGGGNGSFVAGTGITGQGFHGGRGDPVALNTQYSTGGGGGAGGAGEDGIVGYSGDGGPGKSSDITGVSVFYAGGGGGGYHGDNDSNPGPVYHSNSGGSGGIGGGGDGGQPTSSGLAATAYASSDPVIGQNGQANTGGGGGGAGKTGSRSSYGGSGGSGVIILRQLAVAGPSITSQPQNKSAEPGQTKTLAVVASGNGTLSYQWQASADGTNWSNVGTDSSSFTTPSLTLADDGTQYRVVVTNSLNGDSNVATSSVAVISVVGTTIGSGLCQTMVVNDAGVTISQTVAGGCLLEFTSPGNNQWFVPANVSSVEALVVGGGGGGAGGRGGSWYGGGGGGGGAEYTKVSLGVTASQQIPLTVGTGGSAGGNAQDGSDGGVSSFSTSGAVAAGGQGGRASTAVNSGGSGGNGGTGTGVAGSRGGDGADGLATLTYQRPTAGAAAKIVAIGGEQFCLGGGGGGGNRGVNNYPHFYYQAPGGGCSSIGLSSGGAGRYFNNVAYIGAFPGVANTGGGGGGGSYISGGGSSGAAGGSGLVALYYVPGAGAVSLSQPDAMSYSSTANTTSVTLTKDSPGTATWTTSDQAVCTVSGNNSVAEVTISKAGVCAVSVTIAASGSYSTGSAQVSFRIDKINQSGPSWDAATATVAFGGTVDLYEKLNSPSGVSNYTFTVSGTGCSVTGVLLSVGNAGSNCTVSPTINGTDIYLPATGTNLTVSVTKISQSALVLTSATSMNVDQTLTLSAAGGSGTGILEYFVASQGGTSCAVNQSTGALTATAAGSCEVYAKRALSTNYDEVTSSHVVITVNKISQNLSWVSQPQAQYVAGNTYALEATASSQLTVAYSISAGLCTLAGTTVTFTGSGDCVIHAGQSGDASYLEAVTISQTVSVGKINQTMTFSALADKSWGSLAFSLSATASSALAITYTENNQTTNDACDVSTNGIVTIKNVGTCAITATQAGNSAYTSVTTTRLFNVTANQAGAPFIGSVSFGDRQLNASFFTPSYLGGGTVSAYELRAYELDGTLASTNTGCIANAGPTQSCSVIGLTNGVTYVLKVAAITQAGLGQLSASSSEVTPASNPEAVGNLVAFEGNAQLTITWTPPTSLGGGTFDQYRIFWRAPGGSYQANGSPGGTVGNQASTSFVITGLTNGVAYDVKVTTVTSVNTLELQSNTAEVRQTPFTVPDAPAAVVALDNDNNVVVAWQPPVFDGGNPIDQYVVEKDGTAVCTITSATTTSCEVTKPTPGTTSVIEVRAGNDAGLSVAASTSITVQSVQGASLPGIGSGSVSLPGITPSTPAPIVLDVSGSSVVKTNGLIRLAGTNFNLVEKVLIGDVEASFFVNNAQLITIRIPIDAAAGKPTITLQGAFGSRIFAGLIEISITQVSIDTKVTIGTFLGYAAVYTKNHEGKRLSMKIGNKWRVIESLGANYTYNYTKVGVGRTVTVEVYIDRVLVQVKQIRIQ